MCMRCGKYKCDYNDDGFCSQHDYVSIDTNGMCSQMCVHKLTVAERFSELKCQFEDASSLFDRQQTQKNHDAMFAALSHLNAFCGQVVQALIEEHPAVLQNMYCEDN